MKRHPSLIPLSRFHRSVLFLALICKKNAPPVKGYPTDLEGKCEYAISFYNGPLQKHIQTEEDLLFPAVGGKSPELDQLIAELIEEHKQLGQLINNLKNTSDLEEALDALGQLLEKHVRKEERQFFQLIQASLTASELANIQL